MKKITTIIVTLLAVMMPAAFVLAETGDAVPEKVSVTTEKITTTVRDVATPWYKKIDSWRIFQKATWESLKQEKELRIAKNEQTLDNNRDDRVNAVLDEEKASIVVDSGKDINTTGETFFLKLYVALLAVFVIIFSYPVVFYALVIFIIISVISSLINKIRNPHAF